MRIVKNPDGSLQRAALNQAAQTKERRELRAAQREAEREAIPENIGSMWADPIPDGGKRYLAAVCMNSLFYLGHEVFLIF